VATCHRSGIAILCYQNCRSTKLEQPRDSKENLPRNPQAAEVFAPVAAAPDAARSSAYWSLAQSLGPGQAAPASVRGTIGPSVCSAVR